MLSDKMQIILRYVLTKQKVIILVFIDLYPMKQPTQSVTYSCNSRAFHAVRTPALFSLFWNISTK